MCIDLWWRSLPIECCVYWGWRFAPGVYATESFGLFHHLFNLIKHVALNLLFQGLKSLFPLFQVVPMTTWLKVEKWNLCVNRERGTSLRSSSLFSGTVITASSALKGLPDHGPEPKRSHLKDCSKMCFFLGYNALSSAELQKSHWSARECRGRARAHVQNKWSWKQVILSGGRSEEELIGCHNRNATNPSWWSQDLQSCGMVWLKKVLYDPQ